MAQEQYSNPKYLTSVAQLNALLQDPQAASQIRLFDVAVYLRPPKPGDAESMSASSGLTEYNDAHLPGAGFIDQLTELSVIDSPLRFTLPPIDVLTAAFAQAGISDESQVVFYSSGHFMWATRAWWLLRYCGHNNVSVLDGGLAAWEDAGLPTQTSKNLYTPGNFKPDATQRRNQMFVDTPAMLDGMHNPALCTINALPQEMYNGSAKVRYGRPGHIPGSTNLPFSDLMQFPEAQLKVKREIPLQTLLPAAELQAQLQKQQALGPKPVVTYCGGGIAATMPAFAAMLMGKNEIAVYDGSMSEWSQDPARPLVTGDAP